MASICCRKTRRIGELDKKLCLFPFLKCFEINETKQFYGETICKLWKSFYLMAD